MPDLFLDSETFCDTPIKHGTYRYAERAEVMLITWAADDDPVAEWDLTAGEPTPPKLWALIHDSNTLVWLQNGDKFDWPVFAKALPWLADAVPQVRRRDTMIQAYSHSLPGNLEMMAEALGIEQDKRKLKAGRALIRLFCMPQSDGSRNTRLTHPEKWEEFKEYAKQDITAMREAHKRMPMWNYKGKQLDLWFLDQRINNRGMFMDIELAEAAVRAREKAKKGLAKRTQAMTGGAVASATQRDEMLRYILDAYGVDLPDMQADTLERRIKDPDLPDELRELLRVRLESVTTSVAKYSTLLRGVNSDGRLRGTMQFRGAGRTGRVAHRLFQSGNMPRPDMKADEIEWAIVLLKLDAAHLVFPNVMRVCSNAIRGTIIAPPGKKLVAADLSNIEGRKAAWLAGEDWKLRAFEAFDAGEGHDLYIVAYASSFNVPPDSVPLDGSERQIGKVCLAKGSLILTQSGWKPIEAVSKVDLLWDGVEWVSHQGLLSQGLKSVISLAALHLTPDHSVLCGMQWKEASSLLHDRACLSRALARGAAHLPSRAIWLALWVGLRRCSSVAIAGALSMLWSQTTSAAVAVADALLVVNMRPRRNGGGSMLTLCPKPSIVFGYFNDWRQPVFAALHRTMRGGPTMGGEGSGSATSGSKIGLLFLCTFARCRDGMTRSWRWIGRTLTVITNRATSNSSPSGRTCSTGGGFPNFKPKSTGSEKKTETFDLACAGPRRRFTALTSRGPLIVHNCELMFQYGGGVGAWITGAATYGIDLDKMTEQVWDTLPGWAKDEAESFLQWLYEEPSRRHNELCGELEPSMRLGGKDAEVAHAKMVASEERLETRKLKARLGLPERTFIACDAIKRLWRRAHPEISGYWKQIENTVSQAILVPGEQFACRRLKIRRDGEWLRIGLPSGRALCYPHPRIDAKGFPGISYMGLNQYTRKWQRIGTYGGKLFENCIAEGTEVLTEEGWRPINHIRAGLRVWDGYEWVHQQGCVYRGKQPILSTFNVQMTPDHRVLTTEGWRRASSCEGHHRASCRLPDGFALPRQQRAPIDMGSEVPLWQDDSSRCLRLAEAAEEGGQCFLRLHEEGDDQRTTHDARNVSPSCVLGLEIDGGSVRPSVTPSVGKLRGAWNSSVRALAQVVREFLVRYGRRLPTWFDFGAPTQRPRLLESELCVGHPQAAGFKHTGQSKPRHPQRADDSSASSRPLRHQADDASLPARSRMEPEASLDDAGRLPQPVWDLMGCGPRQRFTVRGSDGLPLIVHNCTQAAACDQLLETGEAIEAAGFEIILSEHDAYLTEAPADRDDLSPARLGDLMCADLGWNRGLPLAAKGFEALRNRKG